MNTVEGTLSIPDDKLNQIKTAVVEWTGRKRCSKKQLQSLLGLLQYVSKCVRSARCFLNRMLEVLRQAHDSNHIVLNDAFHRDLVWFQIFLADYNGVSMYGHITPDFSVDLDACLTGLGAVAKMYFTIFPFH